MSDVIYELYRDPYYETVAWGFMEEAVNRSIEEHGRFLSTDELSAYIKENFI